MKEVLAFRAEIDELGALLDAFDESGWHRSTPFKEWTVWDVVAHLHWGDLQSALAVTDVGRFREAAAAVAAAVKGGITLAEYTREQLGGVDGSALLERWRTTGHELCELLAARSPKERIPWYGPDMGLRMFATARQMETWAHAQDVYDLLGQRRRYTDRLENIAVIGVKTFGWTFANRRLEVPKVAPHVRLRAPSGTLWEWNPPSDNECVEGSAAGFCHVVTQGRNVRDTDLRVTGEVATRWMSIAQCFAGPPNDPPAPGVRIGS